MVTALERRQEIIEILCQKRTVKANYLATYFDVSVRTIIRDIEILTLSYPITTKTGKYESGIYLADGYYIGKQYLTDEQEKLLKELTGTVNESQAKILQQIISKFGNPIKQG